MDQDQKSVDQDQPTQDQPTQDQSTQGQPAQVVVSETETQRIGTDGQPLEPPPGHGGRPQVGEE